VLSVFFLYLLLTLDALAYAAVAGGIIAHSSLLPRTSVKILFSYQYESAGRLY